MNSPATCAAATPATTNAGQNRPSFDGKLNGRIDVTRDTRIDLEDRLPDRHRQSRQPQHPGRARGAADLHHLGRHRGLGHRFNRFDIAVKGGAERTVYQNSPFTDGSTASNEDRDYNRYQRATARQL